MAGMGEICTFSQQFQNSHTTDNFVAHFMQTLDNNHSKYGTESQSQMMQTDSHNQLSLPPIALQFCCSTYVAALSEFMGPTEHVSLSMDYRIAQNFDGGNFDVFDTLHH